MHTRMHAHAFAQACMPACIHARMCMRVREHAHTQAVTTTAAAVSWTSLAANQGSVSVETLKSAAEGACIALLDRNQASTEQWRKVFVVRHANHWVLRDEQHEIIDEPDAGCPKGVIADADEDRNLIAEFGTYYQQPTGVTSPQVACSTPAAAKIPLPEAETPCKRQLVPEACSVKKLRTKKLFDEKENVAVANGLTDDVTDLC